MPYLPLLSVHLCTHEIPVKTFMSLRYLGREGATEAQRHITTVFAGSQVGKPGLVGNFGLVTGREHQYRHKGYDRGRHRTTVS